MRDESESPEIKQGRQVKAMMETDGWKVLAAFWEAQEQAIINAGVRARTQSVEMKRWAELDGFYKAVNMARKIMEQGEAKSVEFEEEKTL